MNFWRSLTHTLAAALRDRGLVIMFVAAVPLYSFFYPLPYATQAVRHVPLVVVDQDASALSRDIVSRLAAVPAVRIDGHAVDGRRGQQRAGPRADCRHRVRARTLRTRCGAGHAHRRHRVRQRRLSGAGQGRARQRRRGAAGRGCRGRRCARRPPGRPGGRTAAIGARRAGLHRPAAVQPGARLWQLCGGGGGHPDRAAGDADGHCLARRHRARSAHGHAVRTGARGS